MAFERIKWDDAFPAIAASNINAGAVVQFAASALERNVIPVASLNLEPFGIAFATAGAAGLASVGLTSAVPVLDDGHTVKVTAIGSLGCGADVGVASTNGGLAPVAAASGTDVFRVGKAVSAANVGEVFSLYVKPLRLSGVVR